MKIENVFENDFMKIDISTFMASLNHLGIEANIHQTDTHQIKITCSYKNNPDGSIRWIWPAFSRETDYFKFYHNATLKTKILTLLTRCIMKIGLSNLFADGSFNLFATSESSTLFFNRWSCFMGTIGPNRKVILWHKDIHTQQAYFTKIPLTPQSQENINKEFHMLQTLSNKGFKYIQFPTATWKENNFVRLNDISKNTFRTNHFQELPIHAIQEWLQHDLVDEIYFDSSFKNTVDEIQYYSNNQIHPAISPLLLKKLKELSIKYIQYKSVKTATSHGDFTPWNLLCTNQTLSLIDLELSTTHKPALFDLFHFVYQSNILIGNKGFNAVRKELDAIAEIPVWKEFLSKNKLNFYDLEVMYLVENIFHHIQLYTKQEKWHTQVNWLLQTWNDALSYHLNQQQKMNDKSIFLLDLKDFLKDKDYAYMKYQHKDWVNIPENSDIDLCVSKDTCSCLIDYFSNHSLVTTFHIKEFSYLKQVEIHFSNTEVLYLDLILEFKRRNNIYINASAILARAQLNIHQIKLANPVDEFLYIYLFYTLNQALIPVKYHSKLINIFLTVSAKEQTFILESIGLTDTELFLALNYQQHPFAQISNHIKNYKQNKGIHRLINYVVYLFDTIFSFFQPNGYVVTFSGVDGAGKSTVIEKVKYILEKKYRKPIIVLRHRPSILPIISAWKYGKKNAEKLSVEKLPRTGTNQSKLSSSVRFLYYYLDYIFGQMIIYFKYTSRGYIVLYDRYYFDFINDAKRSNIVLPEKIIQFLYLFIYKPKFNFFLYAPVEEILKRKQELEPTIIQELTTKYMSLFSVLKKKYTRSSYESIMNIDLQQTLSTIEFKLLNAA